MKTCTKCGIDKALTSFYSRRAECRSCTQAAQRAYREANRAKGPIPPGEKHCPRCRAIKPQGDFHRNAARPDGLLAYCKPCWAAIGRERKYGISEAKFDEMMLEQEAACSICLIPFAGLPQVDHCHATGVVRGLLCSECNTGLGKFKDDADRLRRAARYLELR